MPPELREVMIENAPTFLDEASDAEQLAFGLAWLEGFARPVLLSHRATRARRPSRRSSPGSQWRCPTPRS